MGALAIACAVLIGGEGDAAAGTGVQYSRDRSSTLVSKDVGPERWAITYRIADGEAFGNVFYSDGRDPSFVSCTRTSIDGANGNFACFGADACTASPCPVEQYRPIAEVTLPLSFFFPPAGATETDVSGAYDVSGISRTGTTCDARLASFVDATFAARGGCVFRATQTGLAVTIASECGSTYAGTTSAAGLIQASERADTTSGACTTTVQTEIRVDASQDLSRLEVETSFDFADDCVYPGGSEPMADCTATGEALWIRIP